MNPRGHTYKNENESTGSSLFITFNNPIASFIFSVL